MDDRIGHYRVLSRLGAGGMGEVFLAEDERLERRVAIKRLLANALPDKEAAARLLTEARAVARLEHPNICGIYEVGEDTSGPFIVMPVIDGRLLSDRLTAGPLPIAAAVEIAAQISDALATAHGQGILHRDIKPANVMVDARGQARVMDFGLAKFTGAADVAARARHTAGLVTAPGTTLGTAAYMSPEQARGEPVDARSDLFSLGAVLYEMVGGRRPFDGPSLAAILTATQTQEPPPLPRLRPETPDELQRIVSKALRKSPEERYQSANDLLVDLRTLSRALQTGEASARATVVLPPRPRRVPLAFAVVGGAAVVALVAAGIVLSRASYRQAGAAAPAGSEITSLAVLPLVNNSGNSEKEYVADGITESLIRSLSQVPKLTVLSRNTVFQFKGRTAEAQKIATQLGVRAVMTGTITKADDQLVIDIELSDATNANVILSQRYLQPFSRTPNMESDIAQDVARNLQLKLTGDDRQRLAKVSTTNAEAYQFYLKGRFYNNRGTPDAIHQAIGYYQQALALDPNYALAHAATGQSYVELGLYFEAPKDVMPLAKTFAKRAIELDPNLADGRIVLGLVNLTYDWDWDAAAKATTTSTGMIPEAVGMFSCATHLLESTGHGSQAESAIKGALAMDPLSVPLNTELGCNAYYQHRYDEAVIGYRNAIALDRANVVAYWGLGKALDHQHKYREALDELGKATAPGEPVPPIVLAEMGCAYAGAGQTAEAHRVLDALGVMARKVFVDPYLVATVYLALNDKPRTFASLEQAYDARSSFMVALAGEPKWDPIRSDPRFQDLVKRVGF